MTRFKALLPVIAAVFLACSDSSESGPSLRITSQLTDIELVEVFLTADSINLLQNNLKPGDSILLTVPLIASEINAVDEYGGIYSVEIMPIDSADCFEAEFSIHDCKEFRQTVESGGEYWTGAGEGVVRVTNAMESTDIYRLLVASSPEDRENSPDRLEAFILYPGRTANVRVVPGQYNLTAEDAGHNEYRRESVSVEGKGFPYCWDVSREDTYLQRQMSGSGSCRLILRNSLEEWTVTGVQIRPSGGSEWSDNNLSPSVLEPGERFSFLLEQGSYDVRIEDEDGDTYTRAGIRVTPAGAAWNVSMEHLDQYIQ